MNHRDIQTICDMHSYRRPQGSESEREFIDKFIRPLDVQEDAYGNLFKIVGPDRPILLWSSHTDSVHYGSGRQRTIFKNGIVSLHKESTSSCLGADDAAGVWLMTEMIRAEIPGLYVFHYGEEHGCVGSRAIAQKMPSFLDGIQAAIAFDRKGTTSVVTHQMGKRCCSDAFGSSLIAQLPGYAIDQDGVCTDTESYSAIIPECTNLSVGYHHAHSKRERLDLRHLTHLRDLMVQFDQSRLVIARDPRVTVYDKPFSPVTSMLGRGYGRKKQKVTPWQSAVDHTEPKDLYDLCTQRPYSMSTALQRIGVTFEDVMDEINSHDPDAWKPDAKILKALAKGSALDALGNDDDINEHVTRRVAEAIN